MFRLAGVVPASVTGRDKNNSAAAERQACQIPQLYEYANDTQLYEYANDTYYGTRYWC